MISPIFEELRSEEQFLYRRPSLTFRPEVIVSAEAPVVLFTVASSEYAGLMWLAELFAKELLPQGVRINGRQLVLDLRETPNLAPYRNLLAYLKMLRISTRRGTIVVVFESRID
jgi:hypothetical protein